MNLSSIAASALKLNKKKVLEDNNTIENIDINDQEISNEKYYYEIGEDFHKISKSTDHFDFIDESNTNTSSGNNHNHDSHTHTKNNEVPNESNTNANTNNTSIKNKFKSVANAIIFENKMITKSAHNNRMKTINDLYNDNSFFLSRRFYNSIDFKYSITKLHLLMNPCFTKLKKFNPLDNSYLFLFTLSPSKTENDSSYICVYSLTKYSLLNMFTIPHKVVNFNVLIHPNSTNSDQYEVTFVLSFDKYDSTSPGTFGYFTISYDELNNNQISNLFTNNFFRNINYLNNYNQYNIYDNKYDPCSPNINFLPNIDTDVLACAITRTEEDGNIFIAFGGRQRSFNLYNLTENKFELQYTDSTASDNVFSISFANKCKSRDDIVVIATTNNKFSMVIRKSFVSDKFSIKTVTGHKQAVFCSCIHTFETKSFNFANDRFNINTEPDNKAKPYQFTDFDYEYNEYDSESDDEVTLTKNDDDEFDEFGLIQHNNEADYSGTKILRRKHNNYFFSEENKRVRILVTGSVDKNIIVYTLKNLEVAMILRGHTRQVNYVNVYDGLSSGITPQVISASEDRTIRFWSLATGNCLRVIDLESKPLSSSFVNTNFGPIVVNCTETKIQIWNLTQVERTQRTLVSNITSLDAFYPETTLKKEKYFQHHHHDDNTPIISKPEESFKIPQIVVASSKKFCTFYSLDGNEIKNRLIELDSRPNKIKVIYDQFLFIGLSSGELKIFDISYKKPKYVYSIHLSEQPINGFEFYFPKSNKQLDFFKYSVYDKDIINKYFNGQSVLDIDNSSYIILHTRNKIHIGKLNFAPEYTTCTIDWVKVISYPGIISKINIVTTTYKGECPLIIVGDYSKSTAIFNLSTCQIVSKTRLHLGAIQAIAIYQPTLIECDDDIKNKLFKNYDILTRTLIISGGSDGIIFITDAYQNEEPLMKLSGHKDGISSLKLQIDVNSPENPVKIVSGDVNGGLIIWNLCTGKEIDDLVKHKEKVIDFIVLNLSKNVDMLVSCDDKNLVYWNDSLYPFSFMPHRYEVLSAFKHDIKFEDWPHITNMAIDYGEALFVENPHLFYLAVQHERSDFLIKFRKYFTIVLPYIKNFNDIDLLTFSIIKKRLISIRIILLCWTELLNRDHDSLLTQELLHATFYFPEDSLNSLGELFPYEFVLFFCSLKLIRNHSTLIPEKTKMAIVDPDKYETLNTSERGPLFNVNWKATILKKYRRTRPIHYVRHYIQLVYKYIRNFFVYIRNQFTKVKIATDYIGKETSYFEFNSTFEDSDTNPQPIATFMLPIRNSNSLTNRLGLFVSVSENLDDIELFNAHIVRLLLSYFWKDYGRKVHIKTTLQYAIFFIIYLLCIYSFKAFTKGTETSSEIVLYRIFTLICIAFLFYYLIQEYQQQLEGADWEGTSIIKKFRILAYTTMIAPFTSTWNAVDVCLLITGIAGLIIRIIMLKDIVLSRCLLAVSSILIWFKILYFMRPIPETGPLVSMTMQIIKDIRVFIIVLFCVMTGFAQALWLLSNDDSDSHFGTIKNSFLNAYLYTLGQNIDLSTFDNSASPPFAIFLLSVFLLMMMILMLNLLIALMGDTFSNARELGDALFLKEQASIIVEQFFYLSKHSNRVKPYLHVLKYLSEVNTFEAHANESKEKFEELLASSLSKLPPITPLPDSDEIIKEED